MAYTAKEQAMEALAKAQEVYDRAVKGIQTSGTNENYKAYDKAKRALNRAKNEARKYWTSGDAPII